MDATETPKPQPRKKKKRPVELPEILENTKRASDALLKLQRGEKITNRDLVALFKSHSTEGDLSAALQTLEQNEENDLLENIFNLYVEEPRVVTGFADIWCPNLEAEMLLYFKQYPDKLYSLHPRKFEELVASIFKNNGFSVELTPETRDGGVDIIAVQHSAFTGEVVSLIECKRYAPNQKVGIGVVQRLVGAVHQMRANKGIVVTTSFFSRDAIHVSETCKHVLALRDYNSLQGWLNDLHLPKPI